MSIASSFLFAFLVYGLAAVISFGVAFLIKGMFIGMRLLKREPVVKQPARVAPTFSTRRSVEAVEAR